MTNAIGTLAYRYNEIGLLMESTNGRGQKTTYQYDDAGRLQSFTDPEGSVSYTYDSNGNLLTTSDSTGTITREYDSLNRLVSYTDAGGNTLHYSYDQVGNLISLTYPDGKVVTYEYDPCYRLSKVTDWAGRVTAYEYDANGLLITTCRPDGSSETRSYDTAGQPVQVKDIAQNGSLINQYDFSYDAAGNITGEQVNPEPLPYMTDDAALGLPPAIASRTSMSRVLLTMPMGTWLPVSWMAKRQVLLLTPATALYRPERTVSSGSR